MKLTLICMTVAQFVHLKLQDIIYKKKKKNQVVLKIWSTLKGSIIKERFGTNVNVTNKNDAIGASVHAVSVILTRVINTSLGDD